MSIRLRAELFIQVNSSEEADKIMDAIVSGEAETILKTYILHDPTKNLKDIIQQAVLQIQSQNNAPVINSVTSAAKVGEASIELKSVETKVSKGVDLETRIKEVQRPVGVIGRKRFERQGGR